MRIVLGADVVPMSSNSDLFLNGDAISLLGNELLECLNASDYRVLNLETPFTDKSTPLMKYGPNLIAGSGTVNGLKSMELSLALLANNHIMDQSEEGLVSTLSALQSRDIPYIGAGSNIMNASEPYIFKNNDITVGIYNCCDTEFGMSTATGAGANPFCPFDSIDHIKMLKQRCDYVIVAYHGGKEHYQYPTPYLQKVCRKMIESGASLVVTQHSHCIGSMEEYLEGVIVYGQGNFLFNKSKNILWKTSLLIQVDFDQHMKISYIPLEQTEYGVRMADVETANLILDDFYKRSESIKRDGFIGDQFRHLASTSIDQYLKASSPFPELLLKMEQKFFKGKLIGKLYSKVKLLKFLNYIECYAHRELLIEGIKSKLVEGIRKND